jgi:hypothetical protein
MPPNRLDLAEGQLVDQLVETLRALPGGLADVAHAEQAQTQRDPGFDARIDAHLGGKPVTLLVEAKKTVYPRDVHQVLWRLKSLAARGDSSALVPVLAAGSLSPGARELLRTEGVGYFDSGGSLYLPATGAYVYIDKPPPKAQASTMRSLFAGRRAQAIHALLVQREQWMGVKDLAAVSLVSPATASEVLTELEKFDWIDTRGQGPNKEHPPCAATSYQVRRPTRSSTARPVPSRLEMLVTPSATRPPRSGTHLTCQTSDKCAVGYLQRRRPTTHWQTWALESSTKAQTSL